MPLRPSDKPTTAELTTLFTRLQSRGIPAAWLTAILAAGKSRREIVQALIERLRGGA